MLFTPFRILQRPPAPAPEPLTPRPSAAASLAPTPHQGSVFWALRPARAARDRLLPLRLSRSIRRTSLLSTGTALGSHGLVDGEERGCYKHPRPSGTCTPRRGAAAARLAPASSSMLTARLGARSPSAAPACGARGDAPRLLPRGLRPQLSRSSLQLALKNRARVQPRACRKRPPVGAPQAVSPPRARPPLQ